MPSTGRPAADEYAPFYGGYVAEGPGDDPVVLLESAAAEHGALFDRVGAEQAARRYAPGKWSVREVIGHLVDAERVFAYRALRFARGDTTPLAGFDENAWMPVAAFDARPVGDVVAEWRAQRTATLALLRGLGPEAWTRRGTASGSPVSVRALAFIIAGHERHHVAVLRERYGVE